MTYKAATRTLPHPLLRPEIVEWDVRHKHRIPEHRRQRYEQAATTPPTDSMTLVIPGFTQHLPSVELQRPDSQFITVSQVFRHIRRHLGIYELPKAELDLYGCQKVLAESSCMNRLKKKGYHGSFDDEFYKINMRGIDLVRGRTRFVGLMHQLDTQGANVWVVALEKTPTPNYTDNVHPILSLGKLPWRMADPPLTTLTRVYGPGNKEVMEDEAITSKIRPQSVFLRDIYAFWAIEVPTIMSWDHPKDPLSVGEVLKAIHAAMSVRYSDEEWPWWDADATIIAKAVYQEVLATVSGEPSVDDSTTYLDTTPPSQHCFLGIWNEIDANGQQVYTLLTQPSLRPAPVLHGTLYRGSLNWDIITNPIAFEETPGFNGPATFPGRRSMSLKIDFMPGESWRIELFRPRKAQFVTVGQVLFMIHQRLVIDKFKFGFSKLPPYLMHEIRMRAGQRPHWNIIDGYKRVDTLRGAFCIGLEHCISGLGEDEWNVCLGRPD